MKDIVLRALEPEDIDLIYRWENDPCVWEYSAAHTPFSRHQLTQYVMSTLEGDLYSQRQLRLVGLWQGQAVGCADLFDYEPLHHRAGMGLLVDSHFRGQGLGLGLCSALSHYCRQHLLLHQLWCHVAVSNIASRNLLEHCGYSRAGLLMDWLQTPQGYEDAYLMQIIL